uniref:Immunoglobulin V-set domain-containing protein n=1 Tax=Labrus bergylta TaxID=56723 RepID=A0A3Q3EVQ2_9LABR
MICVSTGVHCIDLITPGSMVVQPGQSLTLTCQVSGYSLTDNSYATGWIRQREGKPMDWICHRWGGSFYQNNALKNKFSSSRDTSVRTMNSLQTADTAVYYFITLSTLNGVVYCSSLLHC